MNLVHFFSFSTIRSFFGPFFWPFWPPTMAQSEPKISIWTLTPNFIILAWIQPKNGPCLLILFVFFYFLSLVVDFAHFWSKKATLSKFCYSWGHPGGLLRWLTSSGILTTTTKFRVSPNSDLFNIWDTPPGRGTPISSNFFQIGKKVVSIKESEDLNAFFTG